ncbi:MAG: HEAT repeat domain-containing protein [Planctomycetota bacterium]
MIRDERNASRAQKKLDRPPVVRELPVKRVLTLLVAWLTVCPSWTSTTLGGEAEWIWAGGTRLGEPVRVGETCLFRKAINLKVPAETIIEITADDRYVLYVNGRRIGTGSSSKTMQEYDVSPFMEIGRNLVAVEVKNERGDTAAVAARVSVRPDNGEKWFTFSTDASWRTSLEQDANWQTPVFNDRLWAQASSYGTLGETAPWDQSEEIAPEQQAKQVESKERFQIQKGFGIQRVLDDQAIGSVIAMAFNEFGHLLLSREGGPLLLVHDKDEDGIPETVRTYCEEVESVQGILPLNGDVYVTGDGPQGWAMYRLEDQDRNGNLETVTPVLRFTGKGGEHGPHAMRLGPDGMIYLTIGGYAQVKGKTGAGETLIDIYEGDLLPRFQDPGGHAAGVKAPGGTIVRTTTDGSVVEKVAGGVRNAYDFVFHPNGSLLLHDADMEADVNTPWYRPTALFDVTEAGELGWRTGWAKWPEHYFDRLPNLLDTGRGSPTGAITYEHYMFPIRYHNSIFLADWSEGRILNVRLKENGASYIADSEVFLQGKPLNVTDVDVGPDGSLYFCTGGRQTAGGVYRIVYKGKIPDRMTQLGTGIAAAVRQPQLDAAWTRQKIAAIKRELGDDWGAQVAGVAYSDDNPPHYRVRAMNLMELFGPTPNEELLIQLSKAAAEPVRAKAATLLGLHPSDRSAVRLQAMLDDPNERVQRAACEAMLRSGQLPDSATDLFPLLASEDRTLSFVARRVIERIPSDEWADEVVESGDVRLALTGMLALITSEPSESNALLILDRVSQLMDGFLSDADFVDTLRLTEVALAQGKIKRERVPELAEKIANEFPAGESRINHELIKIASYLQCTEVVDRGLKFLKSEASDDDKTLVAMCMQFIEHDWTPRERFELLKYFENAANDVDTGSLSMYMMQATREFARTLLDEDVAAILEQGATWRNAALAAIFKLDRPIDEDTVQTLINLDGSLLEDDRDGDVERRLRTGIIAMLATTNDEDAISYLRKIWRTEPERRAVVAMALAQHPDGDNWDYLVRSLSVLEDAAAMDVVNALQSVPVATDDPMALRQLILLGLRAEKADTSFEHVEKLLEHWTGMQRPEGAKREMRPWQKWYAKSYPDRPLAELPSKELSRWDFDQLVTFLESDEGKLGNPDTGAVAFKKAECINCHRVGSEGSSIGPDLTSIASRFTRREIIESVLFPSHVVSDQYASKKVLTLNGKVHVGMVTELRGGGVEIRDSNNEVEIIPAADIDQILPSSVSVMPSGLLDDLNLREISDMMSYMGVIEAIDIASRP